MAPSKKTSGIDALRDIADEFDRNAADAAARAGTPSLSTSYFVNLREAATWKRAAARLRLRIQAVEEVPA